MSTLTHLLHDLKVPADFAHYDGITEETTLSRLDEWKEKAVRVIEEIRSIHDTTQSSLDDQANIISAIAIFNSDDPWCSPAIQKVSTDILRHYSDPPTPLVRYILSQKLKPVFQLNPNPLLNVSTGRKLPRPAGGPTASQDFYDDQTWKYSPGISNLVSWCISHLQRDAYEDLWHLIIPPVMTLLDDYEARYRLQGVEILSKMLQIVSGNLLRKTGVDDLIRSSLGISLTHLQSIETALLIKAVISASLSLTLLTTEVGSSEQFDQLCALVGEGIINGIWLYASDKPDVILASLDAMRPLIRSLGVGNARYVKALIAQLLHTLKPFPTNPWTAELQISSLRLLCVLVESCPACLPRWKTTILDGVGICWVTLRDSGNNKPTSSAVLTMELRHVCESLAKYCPSVVEDEYQKLIASDPRLFGDLLAQ